jgi:hypothetical protein
MKTLPILPTIVHVCFGYAQIVPDAEGAAIVQRELTGA